MARYVLSIDCGGIKGIIAATILCEIEKKLAMPLSKVFSMVAGSSVGSLISALLILQDARGFPKYTTEDILGFFFQYGKKMFNSSILRKVVSCVIGSRYSSSNLQKTFDYFFTDTEMKNLICNFLVPSYDVYSRKDVIFRNWVEKYTYLKVKDILLAATAAPTYFSPKELILDNQKNLLVDSSLLAGNPVVCAYASAITIYPDDDIYFVSVGCGSKPNTKSANDTLLYWATHIVDLFLDAGMDVIDYQMNRISKHGHYIRINGVLQESSYELSDVSNKNFQSLRLDAQRIVQENIDNINRLSDLIIGDNNFKYSPLCTTYS
ncbi:patatin-like phospholipase family protein [Neoehrlichia mikurensis]|uniref:Patatin-like phospholipase family protein n=1 Tax=Neoehrlichia mikurensis TaxID=89586 RepID=A0A9Q9F3E7_9RICK|nr:patatin-like phospholipase family protein [Neoehrlichia mikurensis]QXK92154.1 patatin-like phospholipase family protein [Neoehrlichia mikurensis]QXK92610.1 patatin-like phospholipase family protein [Neoehrlichia mikurensis]QXK93848.1 patatin-like phospholipase family protein [Neoehrlichia mikurensis]UTO55157.1 patatin-like phospholipase family protein [Neoehrlichia mikurensis]UTO56077.1 patatin-like phospholipase family protein [Neoehrlichia mikurensis]